MRDLLERRKFRYRNEIDLHDAISALFDSEGIAYAREVRVAGGRVDFVVGGIAIEVKIKGSAAAAARQARRYADTGRFAAVLIVSTRPHHWVAADRDAAVPIETVTIGGLGL